MSNKLIIVESPSKCKKIESFLGSQYKCIATMGHFRNLKNLKSIQTKTDFAPIFSLDETKTKHIEKMKETIREYHYSNILLATDDDREGEAIAWHICDVFHLPVEKTPRIIFHEITKPALLKAVSSPTLIQMNLVFSQHSRQILDMIVGYKVSPFLWKYLYNNKEKTLSAGRCQTPALRLVYENYINSQKKEIKTQYKTVGKFFQKNYPFVLNKTYTDEQELLHFLAESLVFKDYQLSILPKTKSIAKPPRPFHTSSLLQSASNVLHYSPKKTMKLCQELYQSGHITYMRTENTKYSAEFIADIRKYLKKIYTNEKYIGNLESITEDSKGKNPHEAIRITHLEVETIEGEADTMYKFIRKHTIESCMSDYVEDVSQIEMTAPFENKYIYLVKIPVFLGWKRYAIEEKEWTEIQNKETSTLFYLQTLKQGQISPPNEIESIVSMTGQGNHYTEASLIQKLEDIGIGRPSTFSSIVQTIQDREYVKKQDIEGQQTMCNDYIVEEGKIEKRVQMKVFGQEKGKLVITPMGIITIEFLLSHFDQLFSYDYTKKMEALLEDVFLEGLTLEKKRETVCRDCYTHVQMMCKPLSQIEKKVYPITGSSYSLFFHGGQASLKRVLEDGKVEYKSVKSGLNLDLKKLERGEYLVEELMEISNEVLGEYEGKPLILKKGKYGAYVEWGESRESIRGIKKPFESISFEDVVNYLVADKEDEDKEDGDKPRNRPALRENKNIVKVLNDELSIRKNAKTGSTYIYYKKEGMKTPKFYSLGKYKSTFTECDKKELIKWITDTYLGN